jgi:uncharacterized protein
MSDDAVHSQSGVPTDRIVVLDVLRGIAILGMFLVHFGSSGAGATGLEKAYVNFNGLFFAGRFYTIFSILFGAGFVIQMRRAEKRGDPFVAMFLRRMLALVAIGIVVRALTGFNILLAYGIWGIPLLLVRNWSKTALVLTFMVCTAAQGVVQSAWIGYHVARDGAPATRDHLDAVMKAGAAEGRRDAAAERSTNYATVIEGRVRSIPREYWGPMAGPIRSLNYFWMFLLGLLAVRLGVFENPKEHRRLIIGLAVFGVMSWALDEWAKPLWAPARGSITAVPSTVDFVLVSTVVNIERRVFGLIDTFWLSAAYIAVVLLLVARNPAWLGRLSAFSWIGRMALTNYVIQVAILDVARAPYALHLSVRPFVGIALALALFAIDVAFSRWWLTRFRFGPLEWLWRSATYASWQPFRRGEPPVPGLQPMSA